MKLTVSAPFGLVKRLLLSLVLALGLANIASAEKTYPKEVADEMCLSAIGEMLIDLDRMDVDGLTAEQMKAYISTKDKELKTLINTFIDEVMSGKTEQATVTLLKIHAVCSKKLQDVEI